MSRAYFCVRHDLGFSSHPLGCMYTHLSENMEAITAPMSCAIMPKDCTSTPALKYGGHHSPDTLSHDDERLYSMEAITAPMSCSIMLKDCSHTFLKVWRPSQPRCPVPWWRKTVYTPVWKYGGHHSPDVQLHDDERQYTHLSENMEEITAPMPCPMMTKDCARPPSNFRLHTRSNCCSREHSMRVQVVHAFAYSVRPD